MNSKLLPHSQIQIATKVQAIDDLLGGGLHHSKICHFWSSSSCTGLSSIALSICRSFTAEQIDVVFITYQDNWRLMRQMGLSKNVLEPGGHGAFTYCDPPNIEGVAKLLIEIQARNCCIVIDDLGLFPGQQLDPGLMPGQKYVSTIENLESIRREDKRDSCLLINIMSMLQDRCIAFGHPVVVTTHANDYYRQGASKYGSAPDKNQEILNQAYVSVEAFQDPPYQSPSPYIRFRESRCLRFYGKVTTGNIHHLSSWFRKDGW